MAESTPVLLSGKLYLTRGYQQLPASELQSMRRQILAGFQKVGVSLNEFGPDTFQTVERILFPESTQAYYMGTLPAEGVTRCPWSCPDFISADPCPFAGSQRQILTIRPVSTSLINEIFHQGEVLGILGLFTRCPLNVSGTSISILSFVWFPNAPGQPEEEMILATPQFRFSDSGLIDNVVRFPLVQKLQTVPEPEPTPIPDETQETPLEEAYVPPRPFASMEAQYQSLGEYAQAHLEEWRRTVERTKDSEDTEESRELRETFAPIWAEWLKNLSEPSEKDREIFSFVRKGGWGT